MEKDKKLPDNIINFKAPDSTPDAELPEALKVEPEEEMLYNLGKEAQKLTVVGVKKRNFDERNYKPVLLSAFDQALEDTKEESYEYEMPSGQERDEIDNVLEKLFGDDISRDYIKHTKILLRALTEKNIDQAALSEAAAYFSELEYRIGRAKSSIIEKMTQNYENTRFKSRVGQAETIISKRLAKNKKIAVSAGERSAVAKEKEKVKQDVAKVQKEIREIVDIKADEVIAKLLGLKSLDEYDQVIAKVREIQNQEAREAYKNMAQ